MKPKGNRRNEIMKIKAENCEIKKKKKNRKAAEKVNKTKGELFEMKKIEKLLARFFSGKKKTQIKQISRMREGT